MSTRSKLADRITAELNLSPDEAKDTLELIAREMVAMLREEGEIVIPGLGRLKTSIRPARRGHNPRSREMIDIGPKRIYKFKPFPAALNI